MFTPPPSPMPRNFGVAVDTSVRSADTPQSEGLLSPSSGWSPASSSRSPSPSPSTPAISSAVTPGSKSPRSSTFAFQHAASQPLQPVSLAMPPPPRSSRSSVAKHSRNSTVSVLASDRAALASHVAASDKKAQGRVLKAFAIGIPLLLVAATLLAQQWRSPIIETLHVADAQRQEVWKRQDTPGGSSLTSVSSTATSTAATPTTTGTRLGDVPPAPADDAQVVLPTPFPQPFDSSISNNFTSTSCSSFFTNFKASRDFRSCRSFGMLHANSREWFTSAQQAVPTANKDGGIDYMNRLVWGTCHTSTDRQTCEGTMAALDEQIRRDCKQELKDKNAVAVAALVGFANWPLYRELGCLINARTGGYCYLDALNSATADDTYLYSLPLGVDIATYNPTCSRCAQQVLAVLQQYTGNSSLPIAKTYPPVREKTAPVCGSDYALEPLASSSVAFGPSLAFFFMVTLVALFAL